MFTLYQNKDINAETTAFPLSFDPVRQSKQLGDTRTCLEDEMIKVKDPINKWVGSEDVDSVTMPKQGNQDNVRQDEIIIDLALGDTAEAMEKCGQALCSLPEEIAALEKKYMQLSLIIPEGMNREEWLAQLTLIDRQKDAVRDQIEKERVYFEKSANYVISVMAYCLVELTFKYFKNSIVQEMKREQSIDEKQKMLPELTIEEKQKMLLGEFHASIVTLFTHSILVRHGHSISLAEANSTLQFVSDICNKLSIDAAEKPNSPSKALLDNISAKHESPYLLMMVSLMIVEKYTKDIPYNNNTWRQIAGYQHTKNGLRDGKKIEAFNNMEINLTLAITDTNPPPTKSVDLPSIDESNSENATPNIGRMNLHDTLEDDLKVSAGKKPKKV